MRPDVQRWFSRRTYDGRDVVAERLLEHKSAAVSVVLPALDEERTIGAIIDAVRRELVERVPLVDEILVVDPGSTDRTAAIARAAGARVVDEAAILPAYGRVPGKGEALWKSVFAATGDLIVWIDADLQEFDPRLVTGLLGPLLLEPAVSFVKASYERPMGGRGSVGGRVTELVARPLLNACWPQLAGIVQPLAGECAARRSLLERLPFVSGYGVEMAMLIDVLAAAGLDAIAQVEVGRKVHEHQDDLALGRMAAQVLAAAHLRLGVDAPGGGVITQFERDGDEVVPRTASTALTERPPLAGLSEYAARIKRAS